jgi:hypothetical protein
MSQDEIQTLLDATDEAWIAQRGLWPHLEDYVGRLDFDLRFRRPSQDPVFDEVTDQGPVILPKLFRRLSTWEVAKKAKMFNGRFKTYLREKNDTFFLLEDFWNGDITSDFRQALHDYMDSDGFFYLWPEELVFEEADSRLTIPGVDVITW